MKYLMVECDRCHAVKKDGGAEWIVLAGFPVPAGHVKRIECFVLRDVHLCNGCQEQLNLWWVGENWKMKDTYARGLEAAMALPLDCEPDYPEEKGRAAHLRTRIRKEIEGDKPAGGAIR